MSVVWSEEGLQRLQNRVESHGREEFDKGRKCGAAEERDRLIAEIYSRMWGYLYTPDTLPKGVSQETLVTFMKGVEETLDIIFAREEE